MDRHAFYHLYVNLNSLVELGLQRRAAQLLASLPDPPPAPELTPEEAEARMMKSFESMDMSALDQVWENLRNTPLDLEQIASDAAVTPREPEPAAADGPHDLEVYMRRAYTYEDVLRDRIDRLFAKADLAAMSRQLGELGGGRSPLIGKLTGPQMTEWLELYDSEDAVLVDLATEMRRLEMEN
jgi:hypothetical protein